MDAAWRDGAGAQASPLEHAWQARGADPRTAAGQTALENTLATAWRDAMDGKEVDMDSVWARAMDEAKAGADANLAGLQEAWRQAGGGEAARRSSAERLIATKALRCTATAWILTFAESSANF